MGSKELFLYTFTIIIVQIKGEVSFVNLKVMNDEERQVEQKNGADLLVDTLVNENVDTIFGYPGGAVLPIYDAFHRKKAPFKHILTRHEQGAIHAAEGYARVTGKPGVVFATSGPGATNLVTGITDAMIDSIPLVIFTGQVAKNVIGTDAFQEADVIGITTPITKYNYQVNDLTDLPSIVREAFHIATTGRPGPVVIDIPKNIATDQVRRNSQYNTNIHLPGYQPTTVPNPLQVTKLIEALKNSKRPLVLAGAGVLFADAAKELKEFVERFQLPVTNTLLGLGSFPGDHELFLGMAGMHGTYAANMAISECDLLINFGARFDDRLTGNLNHFAPYAKVAHVDIDPAEISKNVETAIPMVGDAKEALNSLLNYDLKLTRNEQWMERLAKYKAEKPLWYEKPKEFISPQWFIEQIYKLTKGNAIVTTDVGQHQMWAAQYFQFKKPHRWVTSGGLGTMGFGLPAAIGAQIAKPSELVISIVGDAGFQMTNQELAVIRERNLPVKTIILNNSALGMVRQWQEIFYEERYSESILSFNPDFIKLAESYDIRGVIIDREEDAIQKLEEAFRYEGPVLIDCRIPQSECVYPMVAPGQGLHQMVGVTK